MIALLRTYLDIIALRRGPDAVPSAWLVLYISVALLGLAWIVQLMLLNVPLVGVVPALIAYAAALSLYAFVALAFGYGGRLRQMLASIIACGSIIAVLSASSAVLLTPITGAQAANTIASLVWFWSVPVKGHIVARTVEKHWFFGVGIAMLAFVLRFSVESGLITQQSAGA